MAKRFVKPNAKPVTKLIEVVNHTRARDYGALQATLKAYGDERSGKQHARV
jgi:hypothetical protein